jgi:hypothetical protein
MVPVLRLLGVGGRDSVPHLRCVRVDKVVKIPASSASNGRTWDLYKGGILGRVDDMKLELKAKRLIDARGVTA